jgi:hypothetical protein
MAQAPGLCFAGPLDALPKYFFAGVKHDMEDIQPGAAQAGEYLLKVSVDQDRLRGDEVLAGAFAKDASAPRPGYPIEVFAMRCWSGRRPTGEARNKPARQ